MVDEPVFPPAIALTEAVPADTPVTSPDELTMATELFELVHVNAAPGGLDVAVSCTVPPTEMVADEGLTETDLTFAAAAARASRTAGSGAWPAGPVL
jgi:hypothetical protein